MKRKISKAMAVILSILMLFTCFPAFALTEGTEYDFEVKYLNAYYDTGRWETADGDVHDNQGQVALRWLKDTGEPLYCMQIYNGVDASAATARNIKDTTVWNDELSSNQQRLFTYVSIYGYSNFDYGFSWEDAQLATQMLFWEIETGARDDFSSGCDSWARKAFNNYPDALDCYNKILEACRNHGTRPNFNAANIELKGTGENNAVTLTDRNGVLENFSVTSNKSNIAVSKSGNNLKIWCKGGGNETAALTFTKYKTDINSAFALTGANQTLFYGTLADPVTTRLNVKMIAPGDLELVKISDDGIVAGFKFTIIDLTTNKEYTGITDETGTIKITGLTGDAYCRVQEIVDPNGRYIDKGYRDVYIYAGQSRTFHFSNTLKKGNIFVDKIDSETKEKIIAADGEFMCQEWSKEANAYIDLKPLEWNSETKQYEALDLTCSADNLNKFKLVETKAPTGYVSDGLPYEFTITEDGQNEYAHQKDGSYQFENDIQKCVIHLEKQGEVLTGFDHSKTEYGELFTPIYEVQALEGAEYEIRAAEDIYANGILKASSGDVVDTLVTTKNGADSIMLYPGKYTYQETKAPEGYVLDTNIYEINLEYKADESNVYTVNIKAEDIRQKIELSFSKQMEENPYYPNPDAHKDVLFGIYAADDITLNDEVILTKDSVVDYITVDENLYGKNNVDLPLGYSWYVKEIKTAKGWYLDKNTYPFETSAADQEKDVITIELNDGLPIINEPIIGSVKGIKKGKNGEPLSNAVIGLFRYDETNYTKDTALMIYTTSENGEFVFNDVPYGDYLIKEIEAPKGYILGNQTYKVSINENQLNVEITITNNPVSPKTGTDYLEIIACAAFTISLIAVAILSKKKKKARS